MAVEPNYELLRSLTQQVIEAEVKNTQLNRQKSRAAAKTARTGRQEQEATKENEEWNEYFKAVEQMNGNATYGGWTYAIMAGLEVMKKRPSLDVIGSMFSMFYDLLISYVAQPIYDAWVDDVPKSVEPPTVLAGLEVEANTVNIEVERADGVALKDEDKALFNKELVDEFLSEVGYTKQSNLYYDNNRQELTLNELRHLEKTQLSRFLVEKFGLTFISRPKNPDALAQNLTVAASEPDLQNITPGLLQEQIAPAVLVQNQAPIQPPHISTATSSVAVSVRDPRQSFFASEGPAVLVPSERSVNVPVPASGLSFSIE
jgi:hypothetical protein